jgi:hypothetical protein
MKSNILLKGVAFFILVLLHLQLLTNNQKPYLWIQ